MAYGPICAALDDEARRCRSTGTVQTDYLGDPECYGTTSQKPSWVRIVLCPFHAGQVPSAKQVRAWGRKFEAKARRG